MIFFSITFILFCCINATTPNHQITRTQSNYKKYKKKEIKMDALFLSSSSSSSSSSQISSSFLSSPLPSSSAQSSSVHIQTKLSHFDTLFESIVKDHAIKNSSSKIKNNGLWIIFDDCSPDHEKKYIVPGSIPSGWEWNESLISIYTGILKQNDIEFQRILYKNSRSNYFCSSLWSGSGFDCGQIIEYINIAKSSDHMTENPISSIQNSDGDDNLIHFILQKEKELLLSKDSKNLSMKRALLIYFASIYEKSLENNYLKFNFLNEMHPEIRQLLIACLEDINIKHGSSKILYEIVNREIEFAENPTKLTAIEFARFMTLFEKRQ